MIRIHKPSQPPEILRAKGHAKRRAMCANYTRHAADYRDGTRKFEFDKSIYGHETVKKMLILAQHGKCFLCESKITHIAYGDVEHFRPKAAYCQSETDELTRPGYYWLAYNWENLFLACQLCNQRYKRNLFPLAEITRRANSHTAKLNDEKPLFINPAEETPEDFISFQNETPYAINDNPRGLATIAGAGLNRETLVEKRRTELKKIVSLARLARLHPAIPESIEAQAVLQEAVADSGEYAAMMRVALAAL